MLSSLAIAAVATLGAQLFGSAEALGVNCLASALVCPTASLVNGVVSSAGLANTGNAVFGTNGLTCNFGSNLALIQCNYDANGALVVNALTSTALLCAQNIKTCTSCPAGNALQAGDCVQCTGGLYALAGNTGVCRACPTGYVVDALGSTCTPVASAAAQNCASTSLTCPTTSLLGVAVTTSVVTAGVTTCNYGVQACVYDATGLLSTLNGFLDGCPANLNKACATCPLANGLVNGLCEACVAGTFAVVNGILPCQACPAGFVPTADRSSCVAIAPTGCLTTTSACPAVDAAGNAYNAGLSSIFAANNQLSCVYGAAGLNTCIYGLNNGILTGTSLNNNLCLSTAVTVCASCPAGFALNDLACTACAAGSLAGVGVNVCTVCPATQVPNADQSACVLQASGIITRQRRQRRGSK